jgi:hypothetical protein
LDFIALQHSYRIGNCDARTARERERCRSGIYNCRFEEPPFYPPMRILIVKTSSLGDVIHNLPVIGDIRQHFPDAIIDWCVEESFAAIPRLHPGVAEIVTVAIRRWRKNLFAGRTWREMAASRRRCSDSHTIW